MAVEKITDKEPSSDEKPVEVRLDEEKGDLRSLMTMLHRKLSKSSNSFFFRVPHHLRQVNERVYEPRTVSISPYYRGEAHLRSMEKYKPYVLEMLLQRRNEKSLARYIDAMRMMEEDTRICYDDEYITTMTSDEFVQMLVLDGCFVIEVVRSFACDELEDSFLKRNLNLATIGPELLLLENQLPFFVLEKLFNMSRGQNEEEYFADMALRFFSIIVPGTEISRRHYSSVQAIKHLVELVHYNWRPSPKEKNCYEQRVPNGNWNFIRSAKELVEVGIRFKKVKGKSLFDATFKKGKIQIPSLSIYHDTERIFHNLMAYEQCIQSDPTYIKDYTKFMDCLINSGDDVALLANAGIINNQLGTNEEVAKMFNRLNHSAYSSTGNFYYAEIFDEVSQHCRGQCTLWKVELRNKYFRNPWDWILLSLLAATFLIFLTLVQTVFSVLSYFK
ncbi:hypothetical protein REPUB_Repub16aG0112000 [Reevesia pubescens]